MYNKSVSAKLVFMQIGKMWICHTNGHKSSPICEVGKMGHCITKTVQILPLSSSVFALFTETGKMCTSHTGDLNNKDKTKKKQRFCTR